MTFRSKVKLGRTYKTPSGRLLRTFVFVWQLDPNSGENIHCTQMMEDISGQALPKQHIQPTALVEQLIEQGRMVLCS